LVNAICEPGLHEEVAHTLADRIVANAPLAVRETRRLLLDSHDQTDRDAMVAAAAAQRRLASTEDFAEGPRAFIEKRDPVWKGR
jgi:enoyl-CoA hydratase